MGGNQIMFPSHMDVSLSHSLPSLSLKSTNISSSEDLKKKTNCAAEKTKGRGEEMKAGHFVLCTQSQRLPQ